MAKKEDKKPWDISNEKVLVQNISEEMRKSFIEYSMSVITSRALPDVRDGLKPVHRRILYAMKTTGLTSGAKFRKSATVVGEVLGKYHPHGDVSVYDSMVNMAQEFSSRYPLVLGQGNFGSLDGDSAAAYRYTEAKMSKLSDELLRDIEKETVLFVPNFDGSIKEPKVLPAAIPNLLLNGCLGIAVGMATNIPPHNLSEVVDATVHLIDNPDATNEDLLEHVKGPDFPLGGVAFNKKDIIHAYSTGRGGVVCRGDAEIIEDKAGKFQIVISSIPYRVNRANLVVKIASLVQEKKIQGIKDLRDESDEETRIVIDIKPGMEPQRVLNYLYKHTELESAFNYNMTGLVDGVPQLLTLRDILSTFISHREEVVKRRTEFDLAKAKARAHILEGLKKALDHIDEVIQIIKKSKDTPEAKLNLIKKFKFTEIQAQAILDMRLQKLAGLERKAIEDELKAVLKYIGELEALLASRKKMLAVISGELAAIKEAYGDARRTKIMARAAGAISDEDLIPEKDTALLLTAGGYVKRTDPAEYRAQRRGGQGVSDLETKEEDAVMHVTIASTKSDLLFFTAEGKVYQIKMYDIPEASKATKGKSINNYISLADTDRVTSVLTVPKEARQLKEAAVVCVTNKGAVKKMMLDQFAHVRRSGIAAMGLDKDEVLLSAHIVNPTDEIMLVSQDGQSIRFKESDVRAMGRTAGGVRGIDLDKADIVIGADVVAKDNFKKAELLILTEHGYGKKSSLEEYKTQNRGGGGIKTLNVTDKTGVVVGAAIVVDDEHDVLTMSKKGQAMRTSLKEIPTLGRATQGVRVMKAKEGDRVASIAII
ncbi:MAG TPA: DNA gyrase subunit A [Candidatus Paceibacterota bacterium]